MARKNIDKSQRQHLKFILYLSAVITFALVIEILILISQNKKNSNETSVVLLNQVASILEDNEDNENQLIKTLKEDYVIRAKTVAYILDSKPEAEYDVKELQKIADLMRIDEIHLFDSSGEIYSGTQPQYYGYNFDSGEQMSYFKPMLQNKERTMCQDVTPNTAEGKNMMYAITWNEAGDKMVQVGIEPLRLMAELRNNEIPEVVANMPTYEGIDIMVADADSGVIYGSTDTNMVDKSLSDIGIYETAEQLRIATGAVLRIDGHRSYCKMKKAGDYIVVVAYAARTGLEKLFVGLVIEFLYLLIAMLLIAFMFKKVQRANDEKYAQMAVLESVADIYNSMHLIDLVDNTFREYSARDEVSKAVNSAEDKGADAAETMVQLMTLTCEEDYLEAALEFTDIHTLPDRLKDKKIISEELMSRAIGWYRASFITIETDEEKRPTKVVYVTQNIDKQKKRVEELIFKSNADQLTGLYNRRAYEDDIAEHNDTVKEDNFVFISMDVNGLKTVNDSLGHAAGDELLMGAAKCMKRCLGPYGRVYRTGGDEFIAMIFASERQLTDIKKDFETVTGKWAGTLVKSLNVSCGYVTKREAGNISVHEIAKLADKRMYEAKEKFYEENTQLKRRMG